MQSVNILLMFYATQNLSYLLARGCVMQLPKMPENKRIDPTPLKYLPTKNSFPAGLNICISVHDKPSCSAWSTEEAMVALMCLWLALYIFIDFLALPLGGIKN